MTRLLHSLFSDKPMDPADGASVGEPHAEQPAEPGVGFNTMSPFNNQYAGHLPAKAQFPSQESNASADDARQ